MQVSDEIIKVLEYLGEKLGVTFDGAKENIMPYAQQLAEKYIKWEIATSTMWICVAILLITVFSFLIVKCRNSKNPDVRILVTGSLAIMIVAMLVVIAGQIYDIIQCNIFPEKQIYEYVSSLIQSGRD